MQGAKTVLAQHRPIIQCEILKNQIEKELEAALAGFDYVYFRATHGGLVPVERLTGNLNVSGTLNAGSITGTMSGSSSGVSSTGAVTIQTSGSANIALNTNSLNRMIISSDGNIGIGTTTPVAALEIRGGRLILPEATGRIGIGTTNPQSLLHLHRNDTGDVRLQLTDTNSGFTTSDGLVIGKDSTNNAYIVNQEANANMAIGTGSSSASQIYITSTGRVGIS